MTYTKITPLQKCRGVKLRGTTLLRIYFTAYASIDFAPNRTGGNKNRPCMKQGRKIRGTTLLLHRSSGRRLIRLKSLSDVTVAPVVPTIIFSTLLAEGTSPLVSYCLAPPGNSLQLRLRLLVLLKRI